MTSDSFVPGDVPHCHPSPQLSDMHPEPSPVCQDSGGPTQGGPEAPSTTGGAPPRHFLHHLLLSGILMGTLGCSLLVHRQAGRVAVSLGEAGAQPGVCTLLVHPRQL